MLLHERIVETGLEDSNEILLNESKLSLKVDENSTYCLATHDNKHKEPMWHSLFFETASAIK